jgi:hypothetical protein
MSTENLPEQSPEKPLKWKCAFCPAYYRVWEGGQGALTSGLPTCPRCGYLIINLDSAERTALLRRCIELGL